MITHLKGRLVEKTPSYAVIECNGVGYMVKISLHTYSKLPKDENCKLLTHYAVSVDVRSGASSYSLYGFCDEEERSLFRILITVSGVSANTAGMILSALTPQEVTSAITNGDIATFKTIKGIGPKLAQKIIVELQGKISEDSLSSEISLMGDNNNRKEALSALAALGFDRSGAAKAIKKVLEAEGPEAAVEVLVKGALKHL